MLFDARQGAGQNPPATIARSIRSPAGWNMTPRKSGKTSSRSSARSPSAIVLLNKLAALSITNQRETVLVFDRKTGKPLHNALVWQDRR
ncbi:MAG: FGGY family carbohydrate kinase [Verrucomicrobiota bacterium]